jgi:hypothetical protein
MMKLDFRFDHDQDEFGGILVCKLRRKETTSSDHQSSTGPISVKAVEEA